MNKATARYNNNGLAHILLLLIVVIACTAGLIFYLLRNGLIKTTFKQAVPDTSDTGVDYSGGLSKNRFNGERKIYKNEVYGFEFSYPSGWTYKEVSWDGGSGETSVDYYGVRLMPPKSTRGNSWINVYKVINEGSSIRNYFNENDYSCCGPGASATYLGDRIMSSEKITVDNVVGRKLLRAPEDIPIEGVSANSTSH
jgi:hypothetical protein